MYNTLFKLHHLAQFMNLIRIINKPLAFILFLYSDKVQFFSLSNFLKEIYTVHMSMSHDDLSPFREQSSSIYVYLF